MESEKVYVNGEEFRLEKALNEAEAFGEKLEFEPKDSLRLRLLSEELLGLMSGITNAEYQALFWIDGNRSKYELHLMGKTAMNAKKREELLATAQSNKKPAAGGIMSRLREMITETVINWNDAIRIQDGSADTSFYDAGRDDETGEEDNKIWTLSNYRRSIEEGTGPIDRLVSGEELERSIIAKLADDVKVSIKKDQVEIIIYESKL